jgi:hypothetical protein
MAKEPKKTAVPTSAEPAAAAAPAKPAPARKAAAPRAAKPAATAPKKPVAAKKPAAPKAPATPRARKRAEKPAVSPEQRYRMVQDAAYYIAEKHGFTGDNHGFWLQAEQEIDAQLAGK